MALTTASFGPDQPPRSDTNANEAASIYKAPVTRMDRMKNASAVADDYTTGAASDSAIGDPFIGGDTIKQATTTAGKAAGTTVPGSAGFPGDADWPARFTGGNPENV